MLPGLPNQWGVRVSNSATSPVVRVRSWSPGVDARVAGLRGADELVERDLVGAGQQQ
jgi:hypothetical protein